MFSQKFCKATCESVLMFTEGAPFAHLSLDRAGASVNDLCVVPAIDATPTSLVEFELEMATLAFEPAEQISAGLGCDVRGDDANEDLNNER